MSASNHCVENTSAHVVLINRSAENSSWSIAKMPTVCESCGTTPSNGFFANTGRVTGVVIDIANNAPNVASFGCHRCTLWPRVVIPTSAGVRRLYHAMASQSTSTGRMMSHLALRDAHREKMFASDCGVDRTTNSCNLAPNVGPDPSPSRRNGTTGAVAKSTNDTVPVHTESSNCPHHAIDPVSKRMTSTRHRSASYTGHPDPKVVSTVPALSVKHHLFASIASRTMRTAAPVPDPNTNRGAPRYQCHAPQTFGASHWFVDVFRWERCGVHDGPCGSGENVGRCRGTIQTHERKRHRILHRRTNKPRSQQDRNRKRRRRPGIRLHPKRQTRPIARIRGRPPLHGLAVALGNGTVSGG